MSYLPIILREDNYPQINFRKLSTNRNKKLYFFLNVMKGIFTRFVRKPQKIEKRIIESFLTISKPGGLKVSLQADYKTSLKEGYLR
jgi:hypothetical protein